MKLARVRLYFHFGADFAGVSVGQIANNGGNGNWNLARVESRASRQMYILFRWTIRSKIQ